MVEPDPRGPLHVRRAHGQPAAQPSPGSPRDPRTRLPDVLDRRERRARRRPSSSIATRRARGRGRIGPCSGSRVTPASLELELTLANESDAAMPAGLGWHPYFPRTAATTLTARVTGLWQTDAEVLPVACVAPPPDCDPGRGLVVDRVALDNAFVGWDGQAAVAWPERARSAPARRRAARSGRWWSTRRPASRSSAPSRSATSPTPSISRPPAGRTRGCSRLAPGESVRASLALTPETT